MLRIAVIDGQGGGIGKNVISQLRQNNISAEIIAVGTNAIATSSMIKAGAEIGATGESAIKYNSKNVDVIVGPIGIVLANSMYGELTAEMANAISQSSAKKVLIPIAKCGVYIAGSTEKTLMQYIDDAVKHIISLAN